MQTAAAAAAAAALFWVNSVGCRLTKDDTNMDAEQLSVRAQFRIEVFPRKSVTGGGRASIPNVGGSTYSPTWMTLRLPHGLSLKGILMYWPLKR
ncbi:hypothetical protein B0T25DRAFT_551322 [Lasiosphaeria hispida]|uniref:Secreted protein n=1 Tax=Lasiosphaeria hispida TaxID=260671 RepID=A0AAJ0HAS5_9PEZI|nr:hypothetical protein B0T25DRAFT_551322 [Lasiosphaeria hispida]